MFFSYDQFTPEPLIPVSLSLYIHLLIIIITSDGFSLECETPLTKQLLIYHNNIRDVTSVVTCTANITAVTNCDFETSPMSHAEAIFVPVRNTFLYKLSCRIDPPFNANEVHVTATMTFPVFERNYTGAFKLRFCDADNPSDCQRSDVFLIAGKVNSQ